MNTPTRPTHGFTLVELLLVTVVLGIVAALVLPSAKSDSISALDSAGRIVATDLAYVRQLALTNATTYRVTFDLVEQQYTVEHVGTNPVWDDLEIPPYGAPSSTSQAYVVDLDDLPTLGSEPVSLSIVGHQAGTFTPTTVLEFTPLGATTASDDTSLWLVASPGPTARYLEIRVDAVTGLTWVQPISTTGSGYSAPAS